LSRPVQRRLAHSSGLISDRNGDLRERVRWDRDQPARRTADQPDISDRRCRLNSADAERRGGRNLFGQGKDELLAYRIRNVYGVEGILVIAWGSREQDLLRAGDNFKRRENDEFP